MRRALPIALAMLALPVPGGMALAAPDGVHVVKAGETLNGIANREGVAPSAIAEANDLEAPYVVRIGQKLTIPQAAEKAGTAAVDSSAASVVVAAGDTLGGIAGRTGVSAADIARANGLEPPYVVRIGQTLAIPRGPAPVRVASRTIPASGSDAARSATTLPPHEETAHVVAPGETLGGIAARAKVPRVLIAEANGLAPPYTVKAGQTLQIPRTRQHTVAAGETGFGIALQYATDWDSIAVANGLEPKAPVQPGQKLLIPTVVNPTAVKPVPASPAPAAPAAPARSARFLWPISGDIRRGYATGSDYHDGLDIKAPRGAMVQAAAAGTIKFAGPEKDQFGNLVVIDHGDGWYTAYGFLSRVTVKEGAKVSAGERIGLVGNTGLAKGDELHFEVRQDGKPVDPLDQLPKRP